MKYKISKFTNIVKKNDYIIHNTLSNSVIKVNTDKYKSVIDDIEEYNSFNLEDVCVDKEFLELLIYNNIIVSVNEDEMATLNSMYNDY